VVDVDVQAHHEPTVSPRRCKDDSNCRRTQLGAGAAERRFMKLFSKADAGAAARGAAALNSIRGAATNRSMTHLPKAFRGARMTRSSRVTRATARALALALLIAGCSSSSNTGSEGSAASAGSGDCKTGKNAPFATPAGTPFTLPTGVVLEGEMTGDVDPHCSGKSFVEYGSDLISICVGLRNTTAADITVTIPAGLVFLAKDPAAQNGIILQSHDLKVPAGAVAYFYFRPFCLNEHCLFGRKEDRYTFGNVVSDPRLLEIIGLARTKKLDGGVGSFVFAQVIWDVTGGDGITAEHRAQLGDAKDL
jgi:hypothetical protein